MASRVLLSIAVTLMLLVAAAARAGTYTVSYTGGTIEAKGVDPVTSQPYDRTFDYVLSNGKWGGIQNASAPPPGQASVTCTGQITATFTWSPTGTEPPPSSIIIVEHCVVATYQNQGTRDTGLATSPEGWRYTNKTNPGTSFQVTCTPNVVNQLTGMASGSVYYDASTVAAPKVTVSPKTNGLGWDDTNHRQLAAYSCSVNATSLTQNGWQLSGFSWDTGGDGLTSNLKMGNATGSDLHAASCVGSAFAPGTFNSSDCTLSMTAPDGTVMSVVASKDDCAALGGPIKFEVKAGSLATWTSDANDPTQPYYLQYFYQHDSPPTTKSAQRQQLGKVSSPHQPTGTKIVWTIPSFLYTSGLTNGTVTTTGGDTPLTLTSDAVGTGAVTCEYQLKWVDPLDPDHAAYEATANDDTAASKQLINGTWTAMVNQYHSHRPSAVSQSVGASFAPNYPSGGCGWERDYILVLTDTEGTGMQDVWVQERWDQQPDPSIVINTSVYWTTLKSPLGKFNAYDVIKYIWNPPAPWQSYAYTHYYYAATTLATIGSTQGILVGTFQTHWTCGDPNNSPNPADCGQS